MNSKLETAFQREMASWKRDRENHFAALLSEQQISQSDHDSAGADMSSLVPEISQMQEAVSSAACQDRSVSEIVRQRSIGEERVSPQPRGQ